MKKIVTQVFNLSELSDKAKQKAREWFRHDLEFDSESIIEDAKEIGKFLGFKIEKVYFSGFSSQGDGACFEGSWNGILDLDGLKAYAPKDEELQKIGAALAREVAAFPLASLTVKHRGHYYHDKCTDFDVTNNDENDNENLSPEALSCNTQLIDLSRDFMRWIYRQLEKQYDFEMSDASVDENIKANDYHFTLDGKFFNEN